MRLILFFILLSGRMYSQDIPHTGRVVANNNFRCNEYTFFDPMYGSLSFVDSLYGIHNICDSKNEIEIRFTTSYAPTPIFEILILSYSGNEWGMVKFRFNTDTLYVDSKLNANHKKVSISQTSNTRMVDSLFNLLTENNLFSLPDFNEVKKRPRGPSDGLIHSLTFKVGNSFRTYRFQNTEFYREQSRHKVFRKYNNIFKILSGVELE